MSSSEEHLSNRQLEQYMIALQEHRTTPFTKRAAVHLNGCKSCSDRLGGEVGFSALMVGLVTGKDQSGMHEEIETAHEIELGKVVISGLEE